VIQYRISGKFIGGIENDQSSRSYQGRGLTETKKERQRSNDNRSKRMSQQQQGIRKERKKIKSKRGSKKKVSRLGRRR
jgi:hypothetical protein